MKAPIAWISLQESKGLAQPTSTEGDERRGSVRLKQPAHVEGLVREAGRGGGGLCTDALFGGGDLFGNQM